MKSPFPAAWWSFDLGVYRPCSGTYQRYDARTLPPQDARLFTGDFSWLGPTRTRARPSKTITALIAAAGEYGLGLPAPFLRFMTDPSLQAAVPSCTACEWDPSPAPVPCRIVPGAFTIRFLRDQQDCLFWYLYLLPDGDAQVLCSPIPFDEPGLEVSPGTVRANTWRCAPSFESFVHRFWIENQIWEQLNSRAPELTPAQRAYLDHYSNPRPERHRKVALKSAKKATAPKPIKRTAAARLAAERERRARKPAPLTDTRPS